VCQSTLGARRHARHLLRQSRTALEAAGRVLRFDLSIAMTKERSFADMKGLAVIMMNYVHEKRSENAKQFSYQWPVETMNVLSLPAMVVNGTSAIVWRRDVPRHLLRKEDQSKPWCDDDWALIVMSKTDSKERDERQRLVYPGVIERWCVIEIFADWHDAVREVIGNALGHVVSQPLLELIRRNPASPD